MSPLAISLVVFACVASAGLLAMFVGPLLPEHHLRDDSKDAVKQGLALIATLAGLVLALLVAATKGAYDTNTNTVQQLAADVQMLDRVLAIYGPETADARELLRRGVSATLHRIWPDGDGQTTDLTPGEARAEMKAFYGQLAELSPHTETQRTLQSRALDITANLTQTRMRLFSQKSSSIPLPFLVVLAFWLMILIGGCGLLAPRNATVVVVLAVSALSLSCAMFLILELDNPFEGLMRISSEPLREALAQLGK